MVAIFSRSLWFALPFVAKALSLPIDEQSQPPLHTFMENAGDIAYDGGHEFPWSNLIARAAPALEQGAYHGTAQILGEELDRLTAACGGKMSVSDGLTLKSGKVIKVVTLLDGDQAGKKKIFYNFGIHGREAVSAEIGLEFMTQMCNSDRGAEILKTAMFKIIPVLNVDGRTLAETGGACKDQRKNGNGVDLNRNFAFHWEGGGTNPAGEDYRGPSALSEPESQFLSDQVKSFNPEVFVDIHSGDKSMLMPWSHVSAECDKCAPMKKMLTHLASKEFGPAFDMFGASGATGNPPYTCTGVTNDYMHDSLGIPYSFIFEAYSMSVSALLHEKMSSRQSLNQVTGDVTIDHDSDDAFVLLPNTKLFGMLGGDNTTISTISATPASFVDGECFTYFNPLTKSELHSVTSKWTSVLQGIPEYLNNPSL